MSRTPMSRARVLAAVVLVPLLITAGCGSSGGKAVGNAGKSGVSCSYTAGGTASKDVNLPPENTDPKAATSMVIGTDAGDIPITFDTREAPCTVNSFESLASQGYFDNTTCHRLTTSGIFVLQCGDPDGTGTGGPGYTIPDELIPNDPRLKPCDAATGACTYSNGLIAMAKTSAPNSGGSQFFLIYADSPLPPDYTVFGRTDAGGLKVLKAIAAKGTADGGPDGAPKDKVEITSVTAD